RVAAVSPASECSPLLTRDSANGSEQVDRQHEPDTPGDDVQPERGLGRGDAARLPALTESAGVLEEAAASKGGPLVGLDLDPTFLASLHEVVRTHLAPG